MLQRANHLLDRARERIRAAAEHDPHAWPDGTVLVMEDGSRVTVDHVEDPVEDDLRDDVGDDDLIEDDAREHPLGSPHPDAPDLDSPGGVSGPPAQGRADQRVAQRRTAQRRRSLLASREPQHADANVPNALKTAAAWAWRIILVIAGIYAVLYAAAYMAVVVVPVIVALLLAALLQPGASFLRRHGWPSSLAALAMLIVGVGVVAGIITLVVERFAAGFSDLVAQLDEGIGQIRDFVVTTLPVTERQIDNAITSAQSALADNQSTLTQGALTTAVTVGEVLTGLVLALFTLFFFLKDGRSIWLWMVGLLPADSRAYVDEAARRSWRTLISYVRATAVVALVDAVGIGIALAVLQVPLVVPLAALVFLGAFIPIIGSFLAGSMAVLVALVSNGPITALLVLGATVLIMQLEGHVLQPLLLGRAVRVHPLAVVLAIAAGLLIAGIFGALIAVPTIACVNVAGTYLTRRHEGPRPPEPQPRRDKVPVAAE